MKSSFIVQNLKIELLVLTSAQNNRSGQSLSPGNCKCCRLKAAAQPCFDRGL